MFDTFQKKIDALFFVGGCQGQIVKNDGRAFGAPVCGGLPKCPRPLHIALPKGCVGGKQQVTPRRIRRFTHPAAFIRIHEGKIQVVKHRFEPPDIVGQATPKIGVFGGCFFVYGIS